MSNHAPYITPEGYQRLRSELDELWLRRRPQVTRAVSEAAAMGDRSENAEYIYGKKMLREIDRRVRHLRKRLELLQVVERPPDDHQRVYFAAWVTIEEESGEQQRYRLVGHDEFDHAPGYISIDAPLARALLGRSVDDEVTIRAAGSERQVVIVRIEYQPAGSHEGVKGKC